ncbi:hypothetical protein Tco_1232004, partial [Tanacetum coccineum]
KICELVGDTSRHPLERREGEFRRTIDNGSDYSKHDGSKSCITNTNGDVVGMRACFTYLIGNVALKNACAHSEPHCLSHT